MKFGSVLLLNVLCVAVGLFVYDSLRGDRVRPSADPGIEDPLRADASDDSIGLEAQRLARRNEERLDRVDATLAAQRTTPGGVGVPAPAGAPAPAPDLDAASTGQGRFDENTLTAFSDYLDEINRRKGALRQRRRMELEFRRRGLELTKEEQEAVIAATLDFQRKAGQLNASGPADDEVGRARQLDAYRALQAEYTAAIERSVSEEKARKILKSRLGGGVIRPGGRGRLFQEPDADD